jgi:hypothetical protein
VLLLRVQLPDRPGSLGQVATAMGAVGADISAIEIVQRGPDGEVIDDFMVEIPPGVLPETLVGACREAAGATVLWLSRYPDQLGIESDFEVLNRMAAAPDAAAALTEDAPAVFHCEWAALVDAAAGRTVLGSGHAPELGPQQTAQLLPITHTTLVDVDDHWLPGWGQWTLAVAPLRNNRYLVLGRAGGPDFLPSELDRLTQLALVADR